MTLLIPTLHPSFLLHQNRRLTGVVVHDLQRATDYARGSWKPKWDRSGYITFPTLAQVRKALRALHGVRVAWDIETNGKHPLICDVRCIGFYGLDKKGNEVAISVPLLYRTGEFKEIVLPAKPGLTKSGKPHKSRVKKIPVWERYYKGAEYDAVLAEIEALFLAAGMTFDVWNGQFDSLCSRARCRLSARYDFDGIIAHHVVMPYIPHSLAFVCSLYTDSPFYKQTDDGDAWSSVDDVALAKYNIDDCKVTWIACGKLREELLENPNDMRIYQDDLRYVRECEAWRERGIEVDLDALKLLQGLYTEAAAKALAAMRQIVGASAADALREEIGDVDPDVDDEGVAEMFKPGSLPKLRRVLNEIGVPLTHRTESGAWSTAADFLLEVRRELIENGADKDDLRVAFLDYLFAWREASKILSSFLRPEIMPDGRLHASYSIHVTPTGRLNSKKPNQQNQPKEVRCMYVARKGHKLVAGDWDSLELRIIAYVSSEKRLIEAFDNYDAGKGPKLHKLNTCAIFKDVKLTDDFDNPTVAPKYRAAKAVQYGVNYGAGVKTAFEAARKEMPDLQLGEFKIIYDAFKATYPRLFEWQKEWVQQGVRDGYLESPIRRRRSYYFEKSYGGDRDTPEAAMMLNFPIQSGASDIVFLANMRVLERVVAKYLKLLKKGEVCIQIAQIHDELIFEVPTRLAERFAADFKKVAEEPPDIMHRNWRLPVDVKVVDRWGKLPKLKEAA